jgi:hypothetical protein
VTIKLFAHVYIALAGPTGPYRVARKNISEYRKLAKRYAWTSAKGEVKFESVNDTSELFYTTFNVADLGEAWDQFISEMERKSVASSTFGKRRFFLRVKNEVQLWRDLLVAC